MNQTRFDRIDALLEAALTVEPAARTVWLKEACCGADEALRREVEALLGLEAEAAQLPERADLTEAFAEEAAAFTGQQVSHYRIEARLGKGGMGEVWRARDTRLPRVVALKFLPAVWNADPERVRRFEQEAQAASQLNHPNIITIHEIGAASTEAGGTHFIATEYVEGQTLRQWLTDPATKQPRRLSVAQTLDFATQIASALKAAHAAWIVHRDIKPENIMVRGDGLVKVLDFGIAKLGQGDWETGGRGDAPFTLSPHRPVAPSLTAQGAVLGTASYMSPEQARGAALDGRTDVFSLGLVLYEMVTGARLLTGATLAEAANPLLDAREPLPPHVKFEHAPKELERIIRKTLRRDRAERYATAGELLDDLNRLQAQLANRASRRLVKVAAVGLLLAALIVAAAAWLSVNETWEERVLRDGHTAAVRQAVFSPDGKLLVSVSEDKRVIVWDFAKRERLATLDAHQAEVVGVAFAPDGQRFATQSRDGVVIVWDAARRAKLTEWRDYQRTDDGIAFSPDGRLLASTGDVRILHTNNVVLRDTIRWERVCALPDTFGRNLIFSPSSQQLLVSGDEAVYDPLTGQSLVAKRPAGANWMTLSSAATHLAAITGSGEVLLYQLPRPGDFTQRKLLHRERAHDDHGRSIAFSPDGRLLASAAEHVVLWNAATMQREAVLKHSSIVWSVAFSPDGRWLVSTHGDGSILVWDVRTRDVAAHFNQHGGPVRAVAFANDGQRIATASDDRTVIVWNAATGRKEAVFSGHESRANGVAFSRDGQWLAAAEQGKSLKLWDVTRQQMQWQVQHFMNNGYCAAISPDGRWVATTFGIYERALGRQVVDLSSSAERDWGQIYGVVFSTDGRRLVCVSDGGNVLLWDTATWRLLAQQRLPATHQISVSFAPDGQTFVTGEDEGALRLWRTAPLAQLAVIGQHAARIKSVAFAPDGATVASASDDKTIALWDVARRKLRTRIGTHTAPVLAVAFAPDGQQLLAGGHDHSVRLYARRRSLWGWQLD